MKIFILRHEDRPQDCSFFTPLTKNGLERSVKLVPILKKLNITEIYSSPFIRTLQTVYPFSKEANLKINLEYGLSELHHSELIAKKAVGMYLPEYLAESFNYNPEYKTIIKPEEIKYPETEKDINIRTKRVIKNIITKNIETNANILLVTHQAFCISCLKIVNKSLTTKLDESKLTDYPKGKVSLIFDNEWIYKEIN
jgi:broad specificity phosphatase PhoE